MKKLELKEIQQISLNILKKFRDICKELNLKYFLAFGTLIGAIRHNGFIPWDDDLDVIMPRNDYEKFIDYCINNKDKLGYLELFHYKTSKKYHYGIARLSDSRYIMHSFIDKDCGMGVFIDIYPFDGVSFNNSAYNEFKKAFYLKLLSSKNMYEKHKTLASKLKNVIFKFIGLCFSNRYLLKQIDKIAKRVPFEESRYCGCRTWENLIYNSYFFKESINHKFEDDCFAIPKEYDAFLKEGYGNYMNLPPDSERIAHHFYEIYLK